MIRDEAEDALNLPKGKYEIPLMLFDRFLRSDGQLEYPVSGDPKSPWVPEVYSNVMLANGKLSPYLDVEPRKYRFRVMNGSNAPLLPPVIRQPAGDASDRKRSGAAASARKGEARPVDSGGARGHHLRLQRARRREDHSEERQLRHHAVSRVRAKVTDDSSLPSALRPVERIPESSAVKTRRLTLDETMNEVQDSMGMMLNKTPWHAPVTEKPVINTTEIWELINLTEDTHPIHLHLVRFQVLDRRRFDVFGFQETGELRFTGRPIAPRSC